MNNGWLDVKDMPNKGTFLVWLEEIDTLTESQVGIAKVHPNITFINGGFYYDKPKILYYQPVIGTP